MIVNYALVTTRLLGILSIGVNYAYITQLHSIH
jgi:hypothetical protein